ncbi:sugar ABC transporter permease [Candidatus Aerophobetes bacterium]|nr:sugar ABC transporter permease [Candidatus Aerophobetes bacterium]
MRIHKKTISLAKAESRLGVILMLPVLCILTLVVLYPLLSTFVLSFCTKNMLNPLQGVKFVGFKNFLWIFSSSEFRLVLFNSLVLTFSTVGLQLLLGLIIAILLNMPFKGRGIIRSIFALPWAVPTFVAAFVWIWILDGHYGLINIIPMGLNILKTGIPWLSLPSTALFGTIIAYTWKGMPFVVLTLLAGLQLIPREIQEAARVDGASKWQEFIHITLPSLRFIIIITVLLRTIWTFNWFDFMYLLTGGGPAKSTLIFPIQVYDIAFSSYRWGRASAVGVVMFIIIIPFALLFFRLLSKEGVLE